MGVLTDHPVKKIREHWELDYFIETGTWRGDGIHHALAEGVPICTTIEASPALGMAAVERLTEERWPLHRWRVMIGDSADTISAALDLALHGRVLWWLDAHLPERYGAEGTRLPLEPELRAIVAHPRDHSRDVFIIDDWRLYEDWNYHSGMFRGGAPGDADAIRALLVNTHTLNVDLRREGYLMGTPRCLS